MTPARPQHVPNRHNIQYMIHGMPKPERVCGFDYSPTEREPDRNLPPGEEIIADDMQPEGKLSKDRGPDAKTWTDHHSYERDQQAEGNGVRQSIVPGKERARPEKNGCRVNIRQNRGQKDSLLKKPVSPAPARNQPSNPCVSKYLHAGYTA
jgi:hypothetical protein